MSDEGGSDKGRCQAAPLIFIVDDDAGVRSALSRLLRSLGFRTSVFGDPRELLSRDVTEKPDLLLLDVHLPGMSGFELFERVRAAGLDTPAIFISAHSDSFTDFHATEVGGAAFLAKPLDERTLVNAIGQTLGRSPIRPTPERRSQSKGGQTGLGNRRP